MTREQLCNEMTPEKMDCEIERIKEAPECMVLYEAFMSDKEKIEKYRTLLEISGCDFHESIWLSRAKVKFVKGGIKMHFEAA